MSAQTSKSAPENAVIPLGISMAGVEWAMESYLRETAERFTALTVLEIGTGYGETITALASLLCEHPKWRAISVDLSDGYSFDRATVKQNAATHELLAVIDPTNSYPEWKRLNVYLTGARSFLGYWREQINDPIHFALIDGCHCLECVTADFTDIEPFVPRGGIVAFHDFGEDSVGEPQPHGGTGDTLGACRDLGLLTGRSTWRFLEHVTGDKENDGRDLGVFRRI